MEHSAWLYAGFLAFVLAALLIDLKVFHAEAKAVTIKESGIWATIWISLGIAFGIGVFFWMGPTSAGEYFAGFLIEKALSVDNIFVFLVIFSYFRVRPEHQHQVLFYGILGAIIFRGLFIFAGIALINRFEWVLYLMGLLLLYSAYKIGRGTDSVHPEANPVLKVFRRTFPTTSQYHGQKLFVRENGKRVATPLFVVLLVIEVTDVAFAVDSIPAIFAITRDPFIILTSNVFAILGLRALYFLLASSVERFHLLKYGLAFILAFVGVKMLAADFWHAPIGLSLGVIVGTLAITVVASLKTTPKQEVLEDLAPPEKVLDPTEPKQYEEESAQSPSPDSKL